jgi:hypothetical protein
MARTILGSCTKRRAKTLAGILLIATALSGLGSPVFAQGGAPSLRLSSCRLREEGLQADPKILKKSLQPVA